MSRGLQELVGRVENDGLANDPSPSPLSWGGRQGDAAFVVQGKRRRASLAAALHIIKRRGFPCVSILPRSAATRKMEF